MSFQALDLVFLPSFFFFYHESSGFLQAASTDTGSAFLTLVCVQKKECFFENTRVIRGSDRGGYKLKVGGLCFSGLIPFFYENQCEGGGELRALVSDTVAKLPASDFTCWF